MSDFKKILSYVPTVIESSSRGEKSFILTPDMKASKGQIELILKNN